MLQRMPLTAATALMLGGCAGLGSSCSDCLPPKTYDCCYCSPKDRWITKQTARGCAQRDLKEFYGKKCKPSAHFAEGFEQAYVDIALGKTQAVPAVPPSKYWNAYYRSCAGGEAVQDWFAGYAAGLEVGRDRGVSRFNRIGTSWSNGAPCGPNGP